MAERKLNFNAPLLSVRRFSTPPRSCDGRKEKIIENSLSNGQHNLPFDRSDVNLEQLTEPVAVPFHWEQIPGRAKDGGMAKTPVRKENSITPRIPPGKIFNAIKYHEEKKIEYKNGLRPQLEACSFHNKGHERGCPKERVTEKAGLDSQNGNSDDDDVYSDALDTLSPTDSRSMNCSESGVSGCEGSIVKRSGTFSTDPHTRDFMMRRFLPAAKAMTLESPNYTPRKQPMAVDQSIQITKVADGDRSRTPPSNQYEPVAIPMNIQGIVEDESDDESDQRSNSAKISTKARGWVPWLCFKNSLCLLNPIPGMKHRTQTSMSSTHNVQKPSKATYGRSHSQTMKKYLQDATYKYKPDSGTRSPRVLEVENKLTCGSNRFNYASDWQPSSRTSPLRRSGGISPYRNEAPLSPFRGVGFVGIPKEAENFKANRSNWHSKGISKSHELFPLHATKRGSRPASPIFEKTLYVDTVKMAETPCLGAGSSDLKECVEFARKEFKTLSKSREMKKFASTESSFLAAKCLNATEGESKEEHKALASGDTDLSPLSNTLPIEGQTDTTKDMSLEFKALVCMSATTDGNLDNDTDWISKDGPEQDKTDVIQYPLPPVLPKTPSESWLWRTLPSISSQSPYSYLNRGSSFQSKLPDPKTASTNTKWETIVKSSYLHNDHMRYSEELILYDSQHSKI